MFEESTLNCGIEIPQVNGTVHPNIKIRLLFIICLSFQTCMLFFFLHWNKSNDKFKETKDTCLQHQMNEFLLSCDQTS